MSRFESIVSLRYLFSGEKKALVSVITLIAVLGVAIGVASLVIVLGVMEGAEKDLFGKVIQLYPHIKVTRFGGETLDNPDLVIEAAKDLPGLRLAEAVISKEALFTARLDSTAELVAGQLVGIANIRESKLYRFQSLNGAGPDKIGDQEVLLGKPLAEKLGVGVGDQVLRITGLTSDRTNRQAPSGRLKVAGIFETGYYAFDSMTAIISAETARKAFGLGDGADHVHIKLDDPFIADVAAQDLQIALGPSFDVTSWYDENGQFFQSIRIQKFGLYLILMLIILVAGFNIIGTLILMVIEKTREIGIMKAIGATNGMIRGIFLRLGASIGLMGTGLGTIIGLIGCFVLKHVIEFEMPPSVYNFDHLPVQVKPLTVIVIVVSAMIICVLASFFPALQASRLDPVEALRDE